MTENQAVTIDWERLSEDLRVRRAKVRIDQRGAAAAMGIAHATLHRVENGKTCSAETFLSMCAWLGAEPHRYTGG